MLPEYKKQADLGLKVAAGHLEGVRRMVQEDAYCIDLMKQLSAVQGTLQRVQRIFLRNHLSSCVSDAIKNGMGESVIDELMTALKYDTSLIDGRGSGGAVPTLERGEEVLPGWAGGTCRAPATRADQATATE
jgi:CsoR family transcriptional regulator, copper-sensing transcriptional repressor